MENGFIPGRKYHCLTLDSFRWIGKRVSIRSACCARGCNGEDALKKSDLDALFVFRTEDARYLMGYRHHLGPAFIMEMLSRCWPGIMNRSCGRWILSIAAIECPGSARIRSVRVRISAKKSG